MQEGFHFAEGEQCRRAGGGLGEVGGDAHHGSERVGGRHGFMGGQVAVFATVVGHPCPALFAAAGEEISEEYGQQLPVLVADAVGCHVGVIYRYGLVLLEGDAV